MSGQYQAEILNREEIYAGVIRLTVRAPEIAEAGRPGQFVMMRCGSSHDPLLSRPFSLHQCFHDGRVQVLFKVIGEGTRRLAALRSGERVAVVGPLGRGFSLSAPPEGVIMTLIGGGLGIAPFMFLAKALRKRLPDRPLELLLGAGSGEEIKHLAKEFRDLGLNPLVATDDGSMGHHGLVTELLGENGERERSVFCCGPHPMMAAVASICRRRQWQCQVSLETMMACGISACLGCATKGKKAGDQNPGYLHVCKNGPVFSAMDLEWS